MNDKFKNVSIDKNTKILFESTMKFAKEDILYQKWYFDNVYGESIIFVSSDTEHMSDDDLKEYVAESDIVKEKDEVTISRGQGNFTFVNFNFITED